MQIVFRLEDLQPRLGQTQLGLQDVGLGQHPGFVALPRHAQRLFSLVDNHAVGLEDPRRDIDVVPGHPGFFVNGQPQLFLLPVQLRDALALLHALLAVDVSVPKRPRRLHAGRPALAVLGPRLVEESAEEVRPQLFERFIGTFFPGARLIDLKLEGETNYSQPLRALIEAESTMWARQTATGLEIVPPRAGGATQLTTLQQRITPLVIYDTAHVRTNVRVKLPSGSSVVGTLPALDYDESGKLAEVTDHIKDGTLHLERRFQLGAMRIAPNEYEKLIEFARKTDAAMQQRINVVLAR